MTPILAWLTTSRSLHRATFHGAIDDPHNLADQIVDLILGLRDTTP